MDIKELAKIVKVPILTTGVFPYSNQKEGQPPVEMTEEELDASIESSNLLQPILLEAVEKGFYRGNEEIDLNGKAIPPVVNAAHQKLFPETLNAALKKATVKYSKEMYDGKPWMVANLDGIPPDVANTFKTELPWRSVELLNLLDPDTGIYHKNVVRSTAFLHKSTRPAVGGQSPEIVVECSGPEDPLTIITTHSTPHYEEGGSTMELAELQAKQAADAERIKELEAEKAEREAKEAARLAELEAAKKAQEVKELALKNEIAELRAAQERSEIAGIEKDWMQPRVFGKRSFTLAPAARDLCMSRVAGNGVAELAEGENSRQKYVEFVNSIIEMAGNEKLLVQTSLEGVTPNTKPEDNTEKSFDAQIAELQEKEGLEYGDAWEQIESKRLAKEAA